MRLRLDRWAAPFTTLLLVTDDSGAVRALEFAEHEARMHRLLRSHYGEYALVDGSAPALVTDALGAYFAGETDALDELAVATGGTAFQREVWKGLRGIPAGETISYGQLAANIGRPSASRAVGAANGQNPVAIIVPCHRVNGASGALTGYAGGLANKQWLLDHERRFVSTLFASTLAPCG